MFTNTLNNRLNHEPAENCTRNNTPADNTEDEETTRFVQMLLQLKDRQPVYDLLMSIANEKKIVLEGNL
ncbi:hypothetical protein [Papillibacter cinnamivorans]|uniref:hypothetical protein n=1 Tax=Papillibacter cinnamivorans TaxID=100176 RepID=UPI0009FE8A61|nr:hypothetical protein [Papillibacter cinnamivorans]